MFVDAQDYSVSNIIAHTGTWEPHYINAIGHIVKPGDTVLNLGPQSGLEAIIMGKIIGSNGKLFIFEPYSFSRKLVTQNIEINGLNDITTIYGIGASDEKSTGKIRVFFSNTGGSEITTISSVSPVLNDNLPPTIGEI